MCLFWPVIKSFKKFSCQFQHFCDFFQKVSDCKFHFSCVNIIVGLKKHFCIFLKLKKFSHESQVFSRQRGATCLWHDLITHGSNFSLGWFLYHTSFVFCRVYNHLRVCTIVVDNFKIEHLIIFGSCNFKFGMGCNMFRPRVSLRHAFKSGRVLLSLNCI